MPRVLFLMPTNTYRAGAFLQAAGKLGVDAVVATEREQALSAFAREKNLTLDFNEPQKAQQRIVEFARTNPIRAVIPVDEETAVLATLASEGLGLPHNLLEGVLAAREKHRMREMLKRAGLPAPDFRIISLQDDPEHAANATNYPCVLKPLFLSTSRGVIRADNPAEFLEAAKRIARILEDPKLQESGGDLANKLLVERYVPGNEVAIEGIVIDGKLKVLAIFDKPDPLIGPYFEETIYVTPSRHPQAAQTALTETVAATANAMGIRTGPVHAELRFTQENIWVIEIAARSIGGLCSQTLRFQQDMTLEEVILMHAMGQNISAVEREALAAGVMMIPIPKAGKLQSVEGMERARDLSGIVDIRITIPLTQNVQPMPEGNRYLGFIFARARTPDAVESALRQAHALLTFEIV